MPKTLSKVDEQPTVEAPYVSIPRYRFEPISITKPPSKPGDGKIISSLPIHWPNWSSRARSMETLLKHCDVFKISKWRQPSKGHKPTQLQLHQTQTQIQVALVVTRNLIFQLVNRYLSRLDKSGEGRKWADYLTV